MGSATRKGNASRAAIVIGTEVEYLIYEVLEGPEGARHAPEALVPPETLREILASVPAEYLGPLTRENPADPRWNGFILKNGGRLYVDGPFLEYSTPECASSLDAGAYEHAGDLIVVKACQAWEKRTGRELRPMKGLVGADGGSVGYHENYGMPRDSYFRLFLPNFYPLPIISRILVPYLVTRVLWSGGGTVAQRDGAIVMLKSQRAASIDRVFSESTSSHHPILHLKRPREYYWPQIHITCGDPSRSQIITSLKVGATAVVLVSMALGVLDDLDLSMEDPLEALRTVSEYVEAPIKLTNGDTMAPLEIQRVLLAHIRDAEGVDVDPYFDWAETLQHWQQALDGYSSFLAREGFA